MRKRTTGGFTVVELLVVAGIIAVLTLIALPAINRFRNSSRVVGATRTVQMTINRTRAAAVAANREHRLFIFLQNGQGNLPVYGLKAYRDNGVGTNPRFQPIEISVQLPEGVFIDCVDSQLGVLVSPPDEQLTGVPANEGMILRPDGQIAFGNAVDVAAARETGGFSLYDTTQGWRLVGGEVLADLVIYDRSSPSYGFMDVNPLTGRVQFAVVVFDETNVGTSGGNADFISAQPGGKRPRVANTNRTVNHGLTAPADTTAAADGQAMVF